MKQQDKLSILCFGDCCGKVGRNALAKAIPELKEKYSADFVIVNSENATNGRGCSLSSYRELIKSGADCLTSGNHFYEQRDVFSPDAPILFEKQIRPLNLAKDAPLKGSKIFEIKGFKVRVTNLLGRVEINGAQSNPFTDMDELLEKDEKVDFDIVDFHAEATGEKRALAEYLDGRISLFVGTHTHVQTNDCQKLNKGTLFISDLGMCGLFDSCLGMLKDNVVKKVGFGLQASFQSPSSGLAQINGIHAVLFKDKNECKIELVNIKLNA